ncbi:pyrimidine utilization transport protein G [Microvirga aerilata]|jgi:putative pyrimidine permease RutG|uniref:Pyrimidine utilization transport protein G n=1 Tax=Microvirga aerilata TaxID=670292 RepID=A0A936Z795_9HYPH|nr:solute carrier family 23 protein [Microvirga aerilata]MBL0405033.1 pyrimidine utilization transport protein G [Microvirga aerilata]
MADSFLPRWSLKTEGAIMPDERLPTGQMVVVGLQHVVAMFGATVLAPILMGFDPNVSILFSGLATLIFFFVVGGRVPSYLGSSFAFIGPVLVATGASVGSPNPNIPLALGGIIAAGALYFLIGLVVQLAGHRWIERIMPPVVTGAIVAAIGLVLAPIAINSASGITSDNQAGSDFARWIALATVVAVGLVAVYAPGLWRRLPVLVGGIIGYFIYFVCANLLGYGQPIDFAKIGQAAWFGLPSFQSPVFDIRAISLIAPVAVILVAENLGHIKAIGAMTGRNLDPYLGRAFMGDGIATMLSGAAGGTGMTTYAENMGVMAVTRIYSTLVFIIAAGFALLLGLSPKFGAFIGTIPGPVLGGLSIVVFGLIAATAGRIWVENRVDFSNPRNLITVAVALILGAGNFKLTVGGFTLDGIGTATFGAIILYHILRVGPVAAEHPQAAE